MVIVSGVLKEEIVGTFQELLPLFENGELIKRSYARGIIGSNEVVTIYGFVGKVESAMITQAVIDRFKPKYFIHCGSAGAISPELKIGDVVCGTEYYEHDFNSGISAPLKASSSLIEKIGDVYPDVKLGNVISGDVLVKDDEYKENLFRKFNALAVDMDSAAVAKVCLENDVEFCAIKVIVDTSGKSAQAEYERYFRKYASLPSNIVAEVLEKHLL